MSFCLLVLSNPVTGMEIVSGFLPHNSMLEQQSLKESPKMIKWIHSCHSVVILPQKHRGCSQSSWWSVHPFYYHCPPGSQKIKKRKNNFCEGKVYELTNIDLFKLLKTGLLGKTSPSSLCDLEKLGGQGDISKFKSSGLLQHKIVKLTSAPPATP